MKKAQKMNDQKYGYILAPTRPDLDRIYVIPEQKIYYNLLAYPDAKVIRISFGEKLDFVAYRLERL